MMMNTILNRIKKYLKNGLGLFILLPITLLLSSDLTPGTFLGSTLQKQIAASTIENKAVFSEMMIESETTNIIQNKAFANLNIIDDIAYIKAGFTHPEDLDEDVMIEWSLYVWNVGEEKIPVLPNPYYIRLSASNHVEVDTQISILDYVDYDFYLLVCKNKKLQDENWKTLFSTESRFSTKAPMNGIWERTGEITSSSAVLHTFLTEKPAFTAREVDTLRVPPMAGFANFRVFEDENLQEQIGESGFYLVDDYIPDGEGGWLRANYNFRWTVTGLQPDTRYFYFVETKASDGSGLRRASNVNSFKTPPEKDVEKPISFVVTHCMDPNNSAYEDPVEGAQRGLKVFDSMFVYESEPPDFVIMQGDTVYYDGGVEYSPFIGAFPISEYLRRWNYWYATYQFSNLMYFFQQVPGYWMVDDHDYWTNNINRAVPDGWQIFRNVNPTPGEYGSIGENSADYYIDDVYGSSAGDGSKYWRSIRWGKYLEIFIEEGRHHRDEDTSLIWGAEQREWLEQQIINSEASFKVISTSTPVLGPVIPDSTYPSVVPDKHANLKFRPETEIFLNNIQDVENVFFIAGDRHYKYHSVINEDNYPHLQHFNEFSSGSAAAPPHAIQGGVPDSDLARMIFSDAMTEIGPSAGYLRVEVVPLDIGEQITFKLISVTENFDNQVVYQQSFINKPNFYNFLPLFIRGTP